MKTPKGIFLPETHRIKDEALREVLEQFSGLLESMHRDVYEDLKTDVRTFPANDATPSVKDGKVFKTANTVATTLTDFDSAEKGQTITVVINDANTTIDFTGSSLKGNAGVDWSPAQYDSMICTFDGTYWYCAVLDNTA